MSKLSDTIERKFVDSIDIDDWEIESESGWVDIHSINKTVEYDVWHLETESGIVLDCADKHILFTENNEEIFVESLCVGDKIKGSHNNIEIVSKIYRTDSKEHMYDLSVGGDHTFFAEGLKHHNTVTVASFVLYQILFNKNYRVAIMANKAETATEILFKIKEMYTGLPIWLQKGVERWNVKDIMLDNGSKVICAATSKSGIRGRTISLLVLDEAAIIPNNIADAFLASTLPTISSGTTTKCVIISTPLGFNHFWKLWKGAENKTNMFNPIRVHWKDHPKHDDKWYEDQCGILNDKIKVAQEIDCSFIGSSYTLIESSTLSSLLSVTPIYEDEYTKVFKKPQENHKYVLICDPSEGVGLDYTAITVICITSKPYEVVMVYRCNTISPELLPAIISKFGETYNYAHVICEINKFADVPLNLYVEQEYPSVMMVTYDKIEGQIITDGFGISGSAFKYGATMDTKLKRFGCSSIKQIIESGNLLVNDVQIIQELSVFVRVRNSFAADEGYNDDLVLTLVIFGWAIKQDYFKEIMNNSSRKNLYGNSISQLNEYVSSIFVYDGTEIEKDENGLVWKQIQI